MKVLLDECVTKRLKEYLIGLEVKTVIELGLSGIKNGKLMQYCADNEIEVLLTIDKNLAFQQNLDRYPVTIVIFNTNFSKIEDLVTFIPTFFQRLELFQKCKAYVIDF